MYKETIIVRSHGQNVFTASQARVYPGMGCTTYIFSCSKKADRWFKWVNRKISKMSNGFGYTFEFKKQ